LFFDFLLFGARKTRDLNVARDRLLPATESGFLNVAVRQNKKRAGEKPWRGIVRDALREI